MKSIYLHAVALGIVLIFQSAVASPLAKSAGAFICDNPAHNELVDLWEGKLKGVEPLRSQDPVQVQIDWAISKLMMINPQMGRYVSDYLSNWTSTKRAIPPNAEIEKPDENYAFAKAGCRIAGVSIDVEYGNPRLERDILWYAPQLIESLPPTDQAALWIHEAIYKYLRKFGQANLHDVLWGVENSNFARFYVSYLFSYFSVDFLKSIYLTYIDVTTFQSYLDGQPRHVDLFDFDHTSNFRFEFVLPNGEKEACFHVTFDPLGKAIACTR